MKHECKITVLETKCFPDLQELYLADPKSGPCSFFKPGDTFLLKGLWAVADPLCGRSVQRQVLDSAGRHRRQSDHGAFLRKLRICSASCGRELHPRQLQSSDIRGW